MIITCPHCQTKYQVTYEAIGSAGRKVQCAHCQESWQQDPVAPDPPPKPETKRAVAALTEDGLDDALLAEEKAVSAALAKRVAREKARNEEARRPTDAGKIDPAVIRKRQQAFSRRQHSMMADQPLARLRRVARVTGAVLLVAVLALAYFGRVQVVQRFPSMAGVYQAVGLGVNVMGLDFSNLTTLRTLRDGKEVLIVSAQIVGLRPQPAPVPAVVVTLIDTKGRGVYEWSVAPSVRDLMAGERATFDTQLTLPPGDAARVRLSFTGGFSTRDSAEQGEPPAPAAAEASGHVEAAPEHGAAEAEHGAAAPEHDAAEAEHGTAEAGSETEHGAAAPEHPTPEHH